MSGGQTGLDPVFYGIIGLAVFAGVVCLIVAALTAS